MCILCYEAGSLMQAASHEEDSCPEGSCYRDLSLLAQSAQYWLLRALVQQSDSNSRADLFRILAGSAHSACTDNL